MNSAELRAEFIRNGKNYSDVAEWLGISTVSLSNKINGKTDFKLSEVKTMIQHLNITPDKYDQIFFDD